MHDATVHEWDALQDVLSAEHVVRRGTEELLGNRSVTTDPSASALARHAHDRAGNHVVRLENLLDDLEEEPSKLKEALGVGIGAALGWAENLTSRTLVQIVRDLYVALNFTAAGYHVLYTQAVLLSRTDIAALSLENLRDYTPIIRELSHVLAWAAAFDLPLEHRRDLASMEPIVEHLIDSWSAEIPLRQDSIDS